MGQFIYVPLVRQAYAYSCGPASLASCLYYWGVWDGREPQLYELCNTTDADGTSISNIISCANHFGLNAYQEKEITFDRLLELLRMGRTVILCIQSWGDYNDSTNMLDVWEDGHYSVLVGMDDDKIYLMDPSVAGTYRSLDQQYFIQCWHNFSDTNEKEFQTGIVISGERPTLGLRPISI